MSALPLTTRFRLGAEITAEQLAFFEEHGFLVFDAVATPDEVQMLGEELRAIEERWIAEKREWVNGVPVFWGLDPDHRPWVQRFTYASMFSERLRRFVLDPRFEPIRRMVGQDARVGHDEKDGVVINRFANVPGSAYPRLGWHTDGLRDLFYFRLPQVMYNVGLHFDEITKDNGGLRLIPGSHRQGFLSMCFKKPYFVWHRPDPAEICVETRPGDLTIHDGRLWHRVERSRHEGWASLRRSMYVPYQTGPHEPKTEASPTPFYHQLGRFQRWLKKLVFRRWWRSSEAARRP